MAHGFLTVNIHGTKVYTVLTYLYNELVHTMICKVVKCSTCIYMSITKTKNDWSV
jgi:hypothetical protein